MITESISMRFQGFTAEQDVVLSSYGACFLDHSPCMVIPASNLVIGELFVVFSELHHLVNEEPPKVMRVIRRYARRIYSRGAAAVCRFKTVCSRRL